MFNFVIKNSLNKYKHDMLSAKLLNELSELKDFSEIKLKVAELQNVNINRIHSNEGKACFWINIYNSLVMFTIIYKKEILSQYYEWYRFLKNSYYNIGGFEISLYEIENCIITKGINTFNIYGELYSISDNKKSLILNDSYNYISYTLSLPTDSFPYLSILFPNNLLTIIKDNAIDYFSRNVNLDIDKNILHISEFITWNDNKFLDHIDNYKE